METRQFTTTETTETGTIATVQLSIGANGWVAVTRSWESTTTGNTNTEQVIVNIESLRNLLSQAGY